MRQPSGNWPVVLLGSSFEKARNDLDLDQPETHVVAFFSAQVLRFGEGGADCIHFCHGALGA